MKAEKQYFVPAIHRGLDILETLVGKQRGLTITELSQMFSIPKSSAFAILQTLSVRGYVQKDEESRYSLTLKIFGLGSALIESVDLRKQLYPLLKELSEKTKITGHIAVLDDGFAVHVEKAEVLGAIRLSTGVGKRMHVHSTAMGKVLIAYLPEEEADQILERRGLPRMTDNTITDPQILKSELARIRNLGYAISNEENEEGIRAVAAPIFNHAGKVVAATNVGGATFQMKMQDMAALKEVVRSYAERMSAKLGYKIRG